MVALGWGVFPLDGKEPATLITSGGLKSAVYALPVPDDWWQDGSTLNLGAVPPEGCWVLDLDVYKDPSLQALADRCAAVGTPCQRSGGGGLHFVFRGPAPRAADLRRQWGSSAIDVKAHGTGYVVVAPSVHPETGAEYEWQVGPDRPTVEAPAWLLPARVDPADDAQPAAAPADEKRPLGIDLKVARELLDHLPFHWCDDYDSWIKAGMALHHEFRGNVDALALWDEWSARCPAKYSAGVCDEKWQSFGRRSDLVTVRTLVREAERTGWRAPRTINAAIQDFAGNPESFWLACRVDAFMDQPAPAQRWLWQGVLPCGKVALLAGSGGSSKSYLMLEAAMFYAAGLPWGPLEPAPDVPPGEVLLMYAEEDRDDIHRRMQAALATNAFSPAQRDRIKAWLYARSLRGVQVQLAALDEDGVLGTKTLDRLQEVLKARPNVRLVVLDPLALMHGLDENNNAQMAAFIGLMDGLALATGATILLVHHFNKTSTRAAELTEASVRGASALVANARIVWLMHRLRADEAAAWGLSTDDHARWVLWTVAKNNYGPWGARHWFNVDPNNGALTVPAVQLEHRPTSVLKAEARSQDVLDVLRWIAAQPEPPGKRGIIRGIDGQLSEDRVKRAVDEAVKDGLLHVDRAAKGSLQPHRLTSAGLAAIG